MEISVETTPNLDIFASEATLFRHAMSSAQWTVPSHSSMFTGLYPSDHAMFHASSVLPASLTTLQNDSIPEAISQLLIVIIH